MAELSYSAITSLDGYVADRNGKFDWAAPDPDVFAFVNDLERTIGTYLYGRRMYDVMRYWESAPTEGEVSSVERDYARIWQAAEKIVFSKTLAKPSTTKTRIEHQFDPDAIGKMKAESSRDLSVGGAVLAGQAIKAGLVDEIHLFVNPIVVGGGNAALPGDVRRRLELLEENRFRNGVVHLRYRTRE